MTRNKIRRRETAQRQRTILDAAADPRHDQAFVAEQLESLLNSHPRDADCVASSCCEAGHASSRAAMIYQHISKDRDRHIADGLSAQIEDAREGDDEVQS